MSLGLVLTFEVVMMMMMTRGNAVVVTPMTEAFSIFDDESAFEFESPGCEGLPRVSKPVTEVEKCTMFFTTDDEPFYDEFYFEGGELASLKLSSNDTLLSAEVFSGGSCSEPATTLGANFAGFETKSEPVECVASGSVFKSLEADIPRENLLPFSFVLSNAAEFQCTFNESLPVSSGPGSKFLFEEGRCFDFEVFFQFPGRIKAAEISSGTISLYSEAGCSSFVRSEDLPSCVEVVTYQDGFSVFLFFGADSSTNFPSTATASSRGAIGLLAHMFLLLLRS